MGRPTRTSLVPPRLCSLSGEPARLEPSSRGSVVTEDGRRLLRAWGSPERPWVLAVEPSGSRWAIESWGAGPAQARAAVRAWFSLDHPLEEFYRLVRREPILRGTDRSFRGLRVPRDASVYEALLHAIVGQQLSVAAAEAITGRLFDRLGGGVEVDGIEVPCVPSPSRLRGVGAEELRGFGLSRAKSQALVGLAEWASLRPPTTARLARWPLASARAALETLSGVGPWTAENALLRGVGRTDVFVAGDLGLRVALDQYGAVPRGAPEEEARRWGDRNYPGWGSYATFYLWRKLVEGRASPAGPPSVADPPPSRNVRSDR